MRARKELNVQIGDRIRNSREIAGLTQEQFSDLVGVTVQYISDLERGVVGTSIPTLIKICNSLNVSSDYLLMGKREPNELSEVIERLKYLPPAQLTLIEECINLFLKALANKI